MEGETEFQTCESFSIKQLCNEAELSFETDFLTLKLLIFLLQMKETKRSIKGV